MPGQAQEGALAVTGPARVTGGEGGHYHHLLISTCVTGGRKKHNKHFEGSCELLSKQFNVM